MARLKTEAVIKATMLRLPETILEACKARAIKERRSLNAQLQVVIEQWLHEIEEQSPHDLVGSRNQ